MALSRARILQVDPYLTKLSIDYANRPDAFIANAAMPFIDTGGKRTGRYRKFTKEGFKNYNGQDIRARLTMGTKIDYDLDTDGTFALRQRVLWDGVDVVDRKEFLGQINIEEVMMRRLVQARMIAREMRVSAQYVSSSVLTNYSALTGDDRWDAYTAADSDPFDDVETMRNSIHSNTGQEMTDIFMGRQVYNKVKHHPLIIDRIKYTMAATTNKITPALLAAAFDVSRVHIGNVLYVSTVEGQNITLGYAWAKNVVGAYIDPNPTNESLTLGLTFTNYGGGAGHVIEKYSDQQITGDIIRIWADEHEVVVDANCGYLLQTVVS